MKGASRATVATKVRAPPGLGDAKRVILTALSYKPIEVNVTRALINSMMHSAEKWDRHTSPLRTRSHFARTLS